MRDETPKRVHKLLVIQIPCYNEEKTLPIVLKELPRTVKGYDKVEWIIINDGSKDRTAEVALENGIDHVVNLKKNSGLAIGFMAGIKFALSKGAHTIVNTDADNQYNSEDIEKLVKPILNNEADIVVGERPISKIEHFSFQKKILQKLGSWTVRVASNTDVPDAPSGFRAMSRAAALQMNVFNDYTYTLETIIQAGHKKLAITSVPIRVNGDLRPSRLVKSIKSYISLSSETIINSFAIYRPFKFFLSVGFIMFLIGIVLGIRWILLLFYWNADSSHVPSLVFASIFILIGIVFFAIAVLANLISVNRKILEELQQNIRNQS